MRPSSWVPGVPERALSLSGAPVHPYRLDAAVCWRNCSSSSGTFARRQVSKRLFCPRWPPVTSSPATLSSALRAAAWNSSNALQSQRTPTNCLVVSASSGPIHRRSSSKVWGSASPVSGPSGGGSCCAAVEGMDIPADMSNAPRSANVPKRIPGFRRGKEEGHIELSLNVSAGSRQSGYLGSISASLRFLAPEALPLLCRQCTQA